jgi:hypothetical protein
VQAKNRKCSYCKKKVPAESAVRGGLRAFCSVEHLVAFTKTEAGQKAVRKAVRQDTKEQLDKMKTRSMWAREAQTAFNAWIRWRDRDKPCISCGRDHQGQYHAGHYRTTAAAPEIRFNTWNVHKQCSVCNNHKSGNIVEYRINLIRRIGEEKVRILEETSEIRRYDIEYLKRIKRIYTKRLRVEKKIVDSVRKGGIVTP